MALGTACTPLAPSLCTSQKECSSIVPLSNSTCWKWEKLACICNLDEGRSSPSMILTLYRLPNGVMKNYTKQLCKGYQIMLKTLFSLWFKAGKLSSAHIMHHLSEPWDAHHCITCCLGVKETVSLCVQPAGDWNSISLGCEPSILATSPGHMIQIHKKSTEVHVKISYAIFF